MNKKRILLLLLVTAILGALIYLQFRTWQKFDWRTFAHVTKDLNWKLIAVAVLIIYVTYVLRALRWKIFLRPVCDADFKSMLGPQFIGFTGLALLGRPGELIRPYLIAKKENLTFSSQVAVWAVERIFDIGAFAVLMAIDVFAFSGTFSIPANFYVSAHLWKINFSVRFVVLLMIFGVFLLGAVAFMAWAAYKIRSNTTGVANWLEGKIAVISKNLASAVCHKVRAFGAGLNTIHDRRAFTQLTFVSLLIWLLIALAYFTILSCYPKSMQPQDVLLLMGASMVGSLLQLPAVGGGSQLATIGVMWKVFSFPQEQAVSAGIMLWLVTFVTCVPVGLIFARFEHVSLRKVSAETQHEEQGAEALEN